MIKKIQSLNIVQKFSIIQSIVLLCVICSFVVVFFYNSRQKTQSIQIDISGRNRMLSQRIAALVLLINAGDEKQVLKAKDELKKSIALLEQTLQVLKYGGEVPGFLIRTKVPSAPEHIADKISEVQNYFNNYKKLTNIVLNETKYIQSTNPSDSINVGNSTTINIKYKNAINELNTKFVEGTLLQMNIEITELFAQRALDSKRIFTVIIFFALILNVTIISLAIYFLRSTIHPLESITQSIVKLSEGHIPASLNLKSQDEIGKISNAVDQLSQNIESATVFAKNVGNGELNTDIIVFGGNGELSRALSIMRDNLLKVSEEDKKRNWTTEGLAKFANILRAQTDLRNTCDDILSSLVKYTNSNQGALFLVNENNPQNIYLELTACYAYSRKKYLNKQIIPGQGLAGQALLEKETIFLTEIPTDYISITSGLGDAPPTSLLIVPLKINEEVVGIIELASFKKYQPHEISFIEKLSEIIASTVVSVKVNEKTKQLLENSQQQAEELRSQEEEMRQNMEEISATQDEMNRQILELKVLSENLKENEKVFSLTTILSEADPSGIILSVNDKLLEVSKFSRAELIGSGHNIFRHPDMPKELFQLFWDTINSGKIFKGIIKNKAKDDSHYWVDALIVPIFDEKGVIVKHIGARYHITNDEIAEKLYNEQAKKLGHPLTTI